jgi:hypothetical protein
MKASLWGARLMALPSDFGCLGAFDLRPSEVGMPRVAPPDSCSYVGYLSVSTLYMFKIYVFSWLRPQRILTSQLQLQRHQ